MARRSPFRNALEAALVRGMLGGVRRAPWLVGMGMQVLDAAVPRLRRVAMRNLELALPESAEGERRAIVDGTFRSLGRVFATLARFPDIDKSNVGRLIRYDGFEHFERAKRAGRGVLFATAHVGNWEFSAFAHALMAEPMSVVVRPLDNPALDEMAVRYRTLSGNTVIGRGKDFLRPLVEALHANRAVGVLVDQNVTADRGIFVDFFGRKACVDSGFARLAHRTGAAVIPGYALWSEGEGKYILRFEPVVEMTGDTPADTQAIHGRLEAAIRRDPGQWLWIHRRWKTRPPGEASLY
ncbi:MAG: lysophospholipid acyltransferase family protein [Candidatus Solibacter usitatus]|nr:lysophospholipid acyltransferase family protein [Candidatus Solibacter usitatus]